MLSDKKEGGDFAWIGGWGMKMSEHIKRLDALYKKVSGRRESYFMMNRGQPNVLTGFVLFQADINVEPYSEELGEDEIRKRYIDALTCIANEVDQEIDRLRK